MSFLLDTNVFSEGFRAAPDPKVKAWLDTVDPQRLYMSVLTLGEIQKGFAGMPSGKRRRAVEAWLKEETQGEGRHQWLSVDEHCALQWGRLMASSECTLPAIDSLIAATAMVHDFTLLTRNTKDFNFASLRVLNPWETLPI